jgi:hypothetical protein
MVPNFQMATYKVDMKTAAKKDQATGVRTICYKPCVIEILWRIDSKDSSRASFGAGRPFLVVALSSIVMWVCSGSSPRVARLCGTFTGIGINLLLAQSILQSACRLSSIRCSATRPIPACTPAINPNVFRLPLNRRRSSLAKMTLTAPPHPASPPTRPVARPRCLENHCVGRERMRGTINACPVPYKRP